MDAAVAALLGTLFGAVSGVAGSIGVMWLQQRHETKRVRMRTAVDLALEDVKMKLAHASPGTRAYPLSMFVRYHARILEAVADGTFSADALKQIEAEQLELMAAVDQGDEERRRAWIKQRGERQG
jgi:hypothetical protein